MKKVVYHSLHDANSVLQKLHKAALSRAKDWPFERAHSWTSLFMISVITINYYLISKHAIFLEQDMFVGRVAVNIRIIC